MNLSRSSSLVIRESLGRRQVWRFPARRWIGCALVLLHLANGRCLIAQEPEAPSPVAEPLSAEALARLSNLVQTAESAPVEDLGTPTEVGSTNGPGLGGERDEGTNQVFNASAAGGTNRLQGSTRSQSEDRRSRSRRSQRPRTDRAGAESNAGGGGGDRSPPDSLVATNSRSASLDYAAFKIIADRNIFNPNRFAHGPGSKGPAPKPKSVALVTLVGTMSYEKGTFAFFDGSSADYRKALKLSEVIVGYKLTNIAPNGVKLVSGTNELDLSVGAQLRREEDGPWQLASKAEPWVPTAGSSSASGATTTSTTGSDAAAGDAGNDVLKRLMQRREKE